jgi:23S rRNA pseudouridine1911/1915/1917 synthase
MESKVGFTSCPILYEDEWLIFIDKPSGVLSHPNPSGRGKAAFNGRYNLSDRRFDTPAGSCWLVHRLDQDTSGVMLAAKSKEAAIKCRKQFEENAVTKEYQALVKGVLHQPHGAWRDHLQKETGKGSVRSRIVRGKAPNAELHYKVLQEWKTQVAGRLVSICHIDIHLISGKTHQIRVQTASRGVPVIGDDIYGDFPLNRSFAKQFSFRKLCLHSSLLGVAHPMVKKRVDVKSAMPEEFKSLIRAVSVQKSSLKNI